MNIAVGSAFRNSANRIPVYLRQVGLLQTHVGPEHNVRVIAVEGDSTDSTKDVLLSSPDWVHYHECSHGGPIYGSTEDPARMRALSSVGNTILAGVTQTDDVLVYVESDLIWDAHTIGSLVDIAFEGRDNTDIVAPLIMAGDLFYDIWAFRRDGNRFSPFWPHFPGLYDTVSLPVDSAGSCLVMRAEVARQCRIRDDNALVGFCDDATSKGFNIRVDHRWVVRHP